MVEPRDPNPPDDGVPRPTIEERWDGDEGIGVVDGQLIVVHEDDLGDYSDSVKDD